MASRIIFAPSAPSSPKAIQWSISAMKVPAARPHNDPATGVNISTVPNSIHRKLGGRQRASLVIRARPRLFQEFDRLFEPLAADLGC